MSRLTFFLPAFVTVALLSSAPAAAQTPSDADLARQAMAAAQTYSNLSIFDDVHVGVDEGVVTLRGVVTMPYKSSDLARLVEAVPGIGPVTNEIRVLRASRTDQELRLRVAQAIYTHPAFWPYSSMPHPPIRILVERGRITLAGQVASEVDRMLAYALAQIDGALGVTNALMVDAK